MPGKGSTGVLHLASPRIAGTLPRVLLGALAAVVLVVSSAVSAPYAGMTIDARNGEILYESNANTKLHPASLTKMMTLYVTFEAVENGEISLDSKVRVSRNAASEQPSRLGLKSGQRIALRYLIRATAVRSANDAATAIAEAIGGSEEAFAKRMTRVARRMGMTHTTFRNAHGLTAAGQLSSARDMSILARHLLYDYPDYYNLFSRRETYAGVKTVRSTNRRFLASYRGSDGIKTGYTRAAGYNLVASAKRGNVRLIVTVFGGKSTQSRNNHVADLLNRGFRKAKKSVAHLPPKRPVYSKIMTSGNGSIQLTMPILRPHIEEQIADVQNASLATAAEAEPESAEAIEVGGSMESVEQDNRGLRPPAERPKALSLLAGSTSEWNVGVSLGRFPTTDRANRRATAVVLINYKDFLPARKLITFDGQGYILKFVGMSESAAKRSCAHIRHREYECEVIYIR